MKIEIEIATDDKNKETIANQIRLLTEKLDEIDQRQQSKRLTLAKIDDTLTQSEIGNISTASSIAQFQDSRFRIFKNHRLTSSFAELCGLKD